jgi:hypothetical protein
VIPIVEFGLNYTNAVQNLDRNHELKFILNLSLSLPASGIGY